MTDDLNSEKFWAFSIRFYSDPAIKATCLNLQDVHGADINMLLVCCWLNQKSLNCNTDLLRQLHLCSLQWQSDVLKPHRAQRRATEKNSPVYLQLLADELQHEKSEQIALIKLLNASINGLKPSQEETLTPLQHYAALLAIPFDLLAPLIEIK